MFVQTVMNNLMRCTRSKRAIQREILNVIIKIIISLIKTFHSRICVVEKN